MLRTSVSREEGDKDLKDGEDCDRNVEVRESGRTE